MFQNADMQCSGCGKNNECHSYSACIEARPDLERPNVRSLVHKFSHVVLISLIVTGILQSCVCNITSSISYCFYPKNSIVF